MKREKYQSIQVSRENESLYYDYIKDNITDYFFFLVDYSLYPEDTEVFMALDDNKKIHGMILSWKNRRIQLRGSIESLEFLLKDKNYEPISITGFEEHKEIITKYFPEYIKEIALYRMSLNKGEYNNFERYPFQVLSHTHKEEIASFMNICDPEYWGSVTTEDILVDDNNIPIAILENNQIICLTRILKYEKIDYFMVVGTHPNYRNKGYASSLICSILNELLVDKKEFLITVRIENPPAIHTYKKMGFSICNTQYSYEKPV